ncbi:hypothetical protein [Phycisphaera mikurensis]|uniref:HEAT repeat domain-containing protein n=1 Tax=Phycisphaera mikurensis (strain NBRC 102666 / KCTC 22515 / FYK2301M01) TaxID=1142394 RepID=I0IDC2_PHYMF|nr:hypothetical protein [Phycisphaera mikurensis]MBB6442384.1 hypothetical protein [Phycisphaera mikurensis]BAM03260.1 hypothetical protein PSMK_11010 [Phycisphaera mikurensis NBRC 102666]
MPRTPPPRRKHAALLAALLAVAGAGVPAGCGRDRVDRGPVRLNEGLLSSRVLGDYRRLSSAGLDLAGRTAAATRLLEDGGQDALRVLAWAVEPARTPAVNQAVLQAIAARPPGRPPPEAMREPLMRRLGDVAPPLLDDLGRALARYERGRVANELMRLAERADTPQPLRNRAIAVLGERRTRPVAELLVALTDARRPGDVRSAAFASLATLSGIDAYGEDPRAWTTWWRDNRKLDAEAWARSLFRNVERREAVAGVNTDQLVDRLVTLNATLYRVAGEADKPRVLTDLLGDELGPLAELGLTLAEQRLSAGEGFDEPLRRALRANLDAVRPDTRRRAAALLRDLGDGPAADLLAARLAAGGEAVTAVLRADLRLLTRQPRVQAVEAAYELLDDPALGPEAAAVLAATAEAGLLGDAQRLRVLRRVRRLLGPADEGPLDPPPAVVTLLGRLGGDRDFARIGAWIDHPDPVVKRAAAQAWADADRPLLPLAQRADDPVIRPVAITATSRRGRDAPALLALAARPPADPAERVAWERALVAAAGRTDPDAVAGVASTLERAGAAPALREAVLTAALDRRPGGTGPIARAALLLARGELRLADGRPRLAVPDFEALVPAATPGGAPGGPAELAPAEVLSDDQRERATRGFVKAALLSDQLDRAFGVARALFTAPGGVLVQPAAGDPLVDLLLDVADEQARAGRRSRARRVLNELRLLLGPAMKPGVSARIAAVEDLLDPGSP